MKILIPVATFERGGGFRVLAELASRWVDAGHSVDFLVDARSADPYFPTDANIIRFDKNGNTVDQGSAQKGFKKSGNGAEIFIGMFRAVRKSGAEYDVILANHSFTALPIALAGTGAAKKWYYVQAYEPEYYSFTPGWRGRVLQAYSALSYLLPLRQVANAPIYIGYRGIRADVWIPPGLDLDLFKRREIEPSFLEGKTIVIGTIGRHEKTKGTVDVLKAFEILAADNSFIRLRVAFGNLPEGWSHPQAEIVYPDGDTALAEYYREVDILVAAGTVQHGACHYPVLEAMASGTPVITTGYLPADSSNSWIVPVNNPEAIANAVRSIAAQTPVALKATLDAAESAIGPFGWTSVAADFLNLLTVRNCGK
ncbi:glycosyltransferase family 4 protein [Massilia sp. S19_KUP03_FR1]|uniref:glycosyltransferase family 4 protein n=1 Tax=Massilia sp. S19_KUP03_FR1 TaxID=3025503 RepID=UPI002FCDB6F8